MSDPRPWLEEGASPELRSLLESARADEPTKEQLASVAARLGPLLVVPAAAAVVAAPSSAAAASASASVAQAGAVATKTGLAVKVLVTVGTVAAVGGAFQAGRVYEEKVAPAKKVIVVEKPVLVPAPAPVPDPAPVVEPEPAAPEAPKPAVRAATPPRPEAEAAMLEQAMSALQAGDAAKALKLCERHQRELGANGLLVQEREVIAIEALVKLGRAAEAKARAEKFKKAFPTSTHLLKVESLVAD